MIQVRIIRSKNGMLRSCEAKGHAGFDKKGFDIVCAAVSSILRTVLALLEKTPSVSLLVNSGKETGSFFSSLLVIIKKVTSHMSCCT